MRHIDDIATARANQSYIRNVMAQALLSREHEIDLVMRWRDTRDEAAMHELIEAHMRQVVAFASKFRNYGIPTGA